MHRLVLPQKFCCEAFFSVCNTMYIVNNLLECVMGV